MTIYIFALHGVATGGPEATHQLSDALIEQGFDARLIYFRWEDLAKGMLAEFPAYEPFAPEYARYKTSLARQAPDEEGAVIVLPETLAHASPWFTKAKVLIWWLSVDNGFGALSGVNLNYLRRPNVYHASQSRYAERFVEALQLNSLGMLSDYTVDLSEYATPLPMSERPKVVAFNARPDKVIADLEAIGNEIVALDPEIRLVAIQGMNRAEIAAVFAMARVYVDLGSFPGKDRAPREAASMDCSVILGDSGAATLLVDAETRDVVDDEFIFGRRVFTTEPAVLASIIVTEAQYFDGGEKWSLASEREVFNTEVRDVFAQL